MITSSIFFLKNTVFYCNLFGELKLSILILLRANEADELKFLKITF